ncbi:transposase [Pectobacterium polaris]|nr:transposase [Pectobacterium polaris]
MNESGKSVARMAQGLDIKENTLYNWKRTSSS